MAVAVVTGGRGIGRAMAVRLAANGLVRGVAVLSKRLDSAENAAEIARQGAQEHRDEGRFGAVRCVGIACDVGNADEVDAAVARVVHELGHVKYLVNAAGATSDGLLVRAKNEAIEENVAVNLLGPMFVCRAVLKDMIKAKTEGSIINVGSVVGTQGNAGQTVYSACKAGLVGFSKSLAKEVASRKIRVNVLEPGYIETDMTASLDHSKIVSSIPLGRFGKPDEVAAFAEFVLVNPSASYITGQVLRVDGGLV